jgi:hypothetical protein
LIAELAPVLAAAAGAHPWPETPPSSTFGQLELGRVRPRANRRCDRAGGRCTAVDNGCMTRPVTRNGVNSSWIPVLMRCAAAPPLLVEAVVIAVHELCKVVFSSSSRWRGSSRT